MGCFNGEIDLEVLPGQGDLWQVKSSFDYVTDANIVIVIPAGLKTDLASTPRAIWWLYPPFGLYTGAAIVHDYLYAKQPFPRASCDVIFLEAMKADGVSWITSEIIYHAVRLFGWAAWNAHKKELDHA